MSVSNNNNVCLPQCCANMNNVDEYGDRSITAAANNEEEYCNEDLIMREIRPDSPFDENAMDDMDCGISQSLILLTC